MLTKFRKIFTTENKNNNFDSSRFRYDQVRTRPQILLMGLIVFLCQIINLYCQNITLTTKICKSLQQKNML
jgi:hypothetical protein